MLSFRDPKPDPIQDLGDDLLFERTLNLLQQVEAKRQFPSAFKALKIEVNAHYAEIAKRKKLHLWNRAVDIARYH